MHRMDFARSPLPSLALLTASLAPLACSDDSAVDSSELVGDGDGGLNLHCR